MGTCHTERHSVVANQNRRKQNNNSDNNDNNENHWNEGLKKNNWQIKWAEMTANMQHYNNLQLQRYMEGREGEYTIPNKPATKRSTNHTVKYHRAALMMNK